MCKTAKCCPKKLLQKPPKKISNTERQESSTLNAEAAGAKLSSALLCLHDLDVLRLNTAKLYAGERLNLSRKRSLASVAVQRQEKEAHAFSGLFALCHLFYITLHFLSSPPLLDLTLSATLAASVKASFTPRFRMAEHSKYLRALILLATSRPWL